MATKNSKERKYVGTKYRDIYIFLFKYILKVII